MTRIVIGTRGSQLALWQARHVKAELEAVDPSVKIELHVIKTRGDKILDVPLSKVGGKGLFVKEIEEALLRREIDLAVHSMKDVPAKLQPGLVLAAISEREDPHDALATRGGETLESLPEGARVGTSSLRRYCQLRARRPDLRFASLRGNVDTRLRKLDEGQYDAVVLAAAGLLRLGHTGRISQRLPYDVSLPAIGQGALGLETRIDDAELRHLLLEALHDEETAACVQAERAFMDEVGGSCQTPVAAHAVCAGGALVMQALVADPFSTKILRHEMAGKPGEAHVLGRQAARVLLDQGAAAIIERARAEQPTVPE